MIRYYFQNTQTNSGTGGIVYDLTVGQGSSATLDATINSDTLTEVLDWQQTVGTTIRNSSVQYCNYSVSVNTVSGTMDMIFQIQRLTSSFSIVYGSAQSASVSPLTTGVLTGTFAMSTTFNPGDILRFTCSVQRTAGHGNVTATLDMGNASTWIEAPQRLMVVS